uniref:Probable ATP-dependent RNA helicase A (inferred by orthology to a C. elegans protein) n=1 Tax=Strongyloides venezuelensis TaxID=75913 RepID=A0A0K0G3X4_STRVS
MNALYNWLKILFPDYEFSTNDLPVEKFFQVNPSTDSSIEKKILKRKHTYTGGAKKFISKRSPPKMNYNCCSNYPITDGMLTDKPLKEISEPFQDVEFKKIKNTVIEELKRKLPLVQDLRKVLKLAAIGLAKRVAEEKYEKLGESMKNIVRFNEVDLRPFGSIVFEIVGIILKKTFFWLLGIIADNCG